jgi:alkylation response protein AidB-like acyl-CoA dehydrogenase
MAGEPAQWISEHLPGLVGRHRAGGLSFRSLMAELASAGVQRAPFEDDGRFRRERALAAIGLTAAVSERCPAAAVATWSTRMQAIVLGLADVSLREWLLPAVLAGDKFGCIGMSEPDAGTDLRGMSTVCTPAGDGFKIEGRKAWLTLGPIADFALVLAKVGKPDRDADMALLLIERSMRGVRFTDGESPLSHPGLPMGEVYLNGVEVPASHVLLPSGALTATLRTMSYARLEAASHGCGLQRAILGTLHRRASSRLVAGMALRGQSHVRHTLGALRVKLAASEALTSRAALVYAAGDDEGDLAVMAKVFATDAAAAAADLAMSHLGSFGLQPASTVAQALLAAKGAQIVDGTNDIMTIALARSLPGDGVPGAAAPEIALVATEGRGAG